MNRPLFTMIMTLCVIFPAIAEDEFFNLPIVVPTPEASEFKVHKDLVYLDTNDDRTRADIYLPNDTDKKHSAIIFVHGGPIPKDLPMAKDWKVFQSYGSLVTSVGLAGVVFNHRFNSLNDLQKATRDITATVNFVRKNAEKYSIDKDDICLWFFSGGGSFVPHFLSERPEWLKCMVLYYTTMGSEVWESWGKNISDVRQTSLDPIPFLKSKSDWAPAFFIAESGKDDTELNAGLQHFFLTAIRNGWKAEYWNHPTAPHGFDVEQNDKRSRAIILRTLDFLSEQLFLN